MPRKYELKRRAERQEETRQRIVNAVVALHEEIGPARTTISAVAERAGVERLTVYRHFADDVDLFAACSNRFQELHPPPDATAWEAIVDPAARLDAALTALYAYYRGTEAMLSNTRRDAPGLPALQHVLALALPHWQRIDEILWAGWDVPAEDERILRAALGHAVDFSTWQALTRQQGLLDSEAVALMVRFVSCTARNGIKSVPQSDRGDW
jgi:AcrR family transcriptional regulator